MGSYFLNIKTNKVHYMSEEKIGCRKRILSNPENYKEYSSLEEIKQTGKEISICNICMYDEAMKEWREEWKKKNEAIDYTDVDESDTGEKGSAGKVVAIFMLIIGVIFCLYMLGQGFWGFLAGVLGLLMCLILLINSCIGPTEEPKGQEKSKELADLAREYGVVVSEFCFNIGGPYDPICIDTVHGLFAGVSVIDTIKRTVVFPVSHILSCSLEEETETVNNAKSRAIVGGILAGSVGAIAGASSASQRQHVIGYLLIVNTDLPKIGTAVFRVNNHSLGVEAIQYLKG